MISRDVTTLFESLLQQFPIVTLTGPRQSGKTTLARAVCASMPYVSLENPDIRRYATDDPRGFLATYAKGAVFDEIQRVPELASYLQQSVDDDPSPGRFVLTGSQQFELMRGVSQSLAGRSGLLRLLPLSYSELCRLKPTAAQASASELVFCGFYPRIHHRGLNPTHALSSYFAAYVERDLRALSTVQDLNRFERFVRLCAGRIGQLLNLQNLANDCGIAQSTANQWMDLLQTSGIVYLLQPWFTNTNKRLIKSPKLYFIDTGLAAWLLNLRSASQLERDPLWGHLFENFVVIEALKERWHHGNTGPLYHYRDAVGHEIDLLWPQGAGVHAIEVKAGATVNGDYFKGLKYFRAVHSEHLLSGRVVFGGDESQMRSDFAALSWRGLASRHSPPA